MKISKKKLGIYVLGVMVLLLCIIIASRHSSLQKQKSADVSSNNSISVEVQPVEVTQEATTLTYNATLEPCEEGLVSSKLSGKVVKVMIQNGEAVNKGKVLVKLDDQDIQNSIKSAQQQLAVTQSQLNAAQNQLLSSQTSLQKLELNVENSQRVFDQAKAMYEQGMGTKTDVDSAENTLKGANADLAAGRVSVQTAQIAVETAKANVNVAKVSVSNYTDSLNDTLIKAPVAGIIDEKGVNLGQYVSAGTTLAKVKDVSRLNAVIHVEQTGISLLKEGMVAQIKLSGIEETYTGALASIGVSADEASRTFTCKVDVGNENGALHPGDFVAVSLISDMQTEVVAIPIKALAGSERDYFVFVFEKGVAKKVPVTIAKIFEDKAIIASGLVKGQSVVTTNLNVLQDGDAVIVSEEGK